MQYESGDQSFGSPLHALRCAQLSAWASSVRKPFGPAAVAQPIDVTSCAPRLRAALARHGSRSKLLVGTCVVSCAEEGWIEPLH